MQEDPDRSACASGGIDASKTTATGSPPRRAGSNRQSRTTVRDLTDRVYVVTGWPMHSPIPEAHDDAIVARLYDVSRELTGLA